MREERASLTELAAIAGRGRATFEIVSNGTGTGGVLGPDNIQVPNGTSTAGTGQYENSNTVRNNAVNKTTEARKSAPGSIKKLNVAVLLDSTTAGAVNAADVQSLVRAAAGIDATRGDTIAVSAMPFDTSAAQQAQNALKAAAAAEQSAKQMSLIKTGAGRPTVNQVLRALETAGAIELHRGRIDVVDRSVLAHHRA